jgi:hypothetical protein
MISVPLQYEFSRGVGVNQGGSEQTLLFQPVAPFDLGGGDTFIVRPIVAGAREASVQNAAGQSFSGYGIANVTLESFYAPNTNSSWIWGIGPYAVSPSGNSGKFGCATNWRWCYGRCSQSPRSMDIWLTRLSIMEYGR